MNTQVQKIKDEIERRVNQFKHARQEAEYDANKLSLGARIAMCEELLVFINSLPEEPINDNLEKEVKAYLQTNFPDGLGFPSVPKVAHHFAKWQKKQMMKDATYATCCGLHAFQALWCFDNLKTSDVVAGDRVKVIIVKEEE